MKVIAIILAVCLVAVLGELTEEQKTILKGFKTDCMKETSVDEAMIDKAKDGEWMMDDMKLRCFFGCMLKKIGAMKEDGTLDVEKTRKKIGYDLAADKVDEVMNKCKDMTGADMCETAMKLMKCYATERAFTMILTEKAA